MPRQDATTTPVNNNAHVNAQGKRGCLSVVCLAVSVSTFLICLATVIVLTVTTVYSLRAADDFAVRYSQSNVVAAASKVSDFVKIPVNAYAEILSGAALGDFPNFVVPPANTTSAVDPDGSAGAWHPSLTSQWLSSFQRMLYSTEFSLMIIAVGFADQTWVACSVENKAAKAYACSHTNPHNETHRALVGGSNANGLFRILDYYTAVQYNHTRTTSYVYDPRIRPWFTAAPKGKGDLPIFTSVYIDHDYEVLIVDVTGPIYHQDGTFLGVSSISLDVGLISTFIRTIPHTDNSVIVLVDEMGFLVAASDGGAVSISVPFGVAAAGETLPPLPEGCERLHSTSLCRLRPQQYSSPAVRALAATAHGAFVNDGVVFTREMVLNGDQWVVSKAPIVAHTDVMSATIGWQIVTLMPVSDVTAQIVKGRTIGIIIAVVIVVSSSVLCAIALFLLLRPLRVLAALMEAASHLRDESLGEDAVGVVSSLNEIKTIQDAFVLLSAQLKRAKSFLPATLLAQLETTDEEDGMGDGNGRVDQDDEGDFGKEVAGRALSIRNNNRTDDGSERSSRSRAPSNTSRHMYRVQQTAGGGGGVSPGMQSADQSEATGITTTSGGPHRVIASQVSLNSRQVSVAVLNLRHFHRSMNESSSAMEACYGSLVDNFQTVARECRGILDSFHGDRFVFTFNAVRPCSTHAAMAAVAMLRIAVQMRLGALNSGGTAVTCGVATGRCMIGNLGSDRSKRFTVVGPSFTYATVLERLCKRYGNDTAVLLSNETCTDAESQVRFLFLDVISTPSGKVAPIARAVSARESVSGGVGLTSVNLGADGDEWMYEMSMQAKQCDYHACNSAFRSALAGDATAARTHLAAFTDASVMSQRARGRVEELLANGVKPSDLGDFYDSCVVSDSHKQQYTSTTIGDQSRAGQAPERPNLYTFSMTRKRTELEVK